MSTGTGYDIGSEPQRINAQRINAQRINAQRINAQRK